MRKASLILATTVGLFLGGCGRGTDDAPPAKGKANLKVTVNAMPKSGAKAFKTYAPTDAEKAEQAASKGAFELVDYEHLEGIVVWFEPVGTGPAPTGRGVKVAIKGKPEELSLTAIPVNESLIFENKGSRRLRLYSVSEGNEFDVGSVAPNDIASHRFESPGFVEVLDGDTFDVLARIYVAPGRAAQIVHPGKVTTFRDLDPGEYRVGAWHERMPGEEKAVTLAADATREVNLLIGVNALPKVD